MEKNYLQEGIWFKARKVTKYVRLYGLLRTLAKIKSQYHMLSTDSFSEKWVNSECKSPDSEKRCVAIIGCGNFAFSQISFFLSKYEKKFLRATYDIKNSRAKSLCKFYGGLYATSDWHEILLDRQVKIVYIASNHASHAEYATACIKNGKHVHIEKPHVVNDSQLKSLMYYMNKYPDINVYLGFNRCKSKLFNKLQVLLNKEQGPMMINWFVIGHQIPEGHWYYDEKEGGRALGNLPHWTDLTLHMVTIEKAFPCEIISSTPVDALSDFVVSIMFADRSCASITFSAKGYAFEGIREVLNINKGNLLANITDFHTLKYEVSSKKRKETLYYRDHGHKANIVNSIVDYKNGDYGESVDYVKQTARLFLGVQKAIDTARKVVLHSDKETYEVV